MLVLSPEQTDRLAALQRERDLAHLGAQVAAVLPEVPSRLGDRFPALVALAAQRGSAHGLVHLLCLARYLACWAALGAEFETRPGFEWAAQLLAQRERPEGARVFQLCRRTRELLASQPLPGRPPAEVFDAALAALDAALQGAGDLGELGARRRIQIGQACDLDGVDLRPVTAAARQQYVLKQGQWLREPGPASAASITLRPGADPAPALPAQVSLLSPAPSQGGPVRLRLRTHSTSCCDPQVHPLVSLIDHHGLREWRGAQAADITWALTPGTPPDALPGALQPTIAFETAPAQHPLTLTSCKVRDAGAPLGELRTLLAVYPADQHLLAWQRAALPPLAWPHNPSEGQPVLPPPRLRLERDGVALDAARWQAGLAELDRQLVAGLGRLASAWERESGVTGSRVEAEPQLLCGDAGIAWGCSEGPQGLAAPPWYRVVGAIDTVACTLRLRLSGTLALHGATSQLRLQCMGAVPLKAAFERKPEETDLVALTTAAQAPIALPFLLALDPLASDSGAMTGVASHVAGALVGACGLRPRPEGPGLQWFARLAIEPVSVRLAVRDPLLGEQDWQQPLLPAMELLNWSLG